MWHRWSRLADRRGAALVALCAVLAIGLRWWIAGSTYGTDDVRYWSQFAAGVREHGPIGIYGEHFDALYNHPPLLGWWLLLVDWLQRAGWSLPMLIRMPASLADGLCGLLLFRLLDGPGRRPVAVAAALAFLFSPLAVIVAGFHGNTDPVFVMFSLAALHQLSVRRRPLVAGTLLALAVSVKIVPVLLVPLFLWQAWRRGGLRWTARLLVGGGLVFAVLWLPVLLLEPVDFIRGVLGYSGNGVLAWGIPVLLNAVGVDVAAHPRALRLLGYAALAVAAALPILVARRSHEQMSVQVGLALAVFWLLSPAFATQYLVWPLAAGYLVAVGYAHLYNVTASIFAVVVYSLWNRALPWRWFEARSQELPDWLAPLMLLTWLALAGVVLHGCARLRAPRDGRSPRPPSARREVVLSDS